MRGIVVRDAAGVALALRAAAEAGLRGPLPLLSPPGAATWLGAPLFLAQIAAGGAAPPGLEPWPVLDCALAPGHALAALRAGVAAVVLLPECPAFPALAALAPGRVLPAAPPSLDLAARNPRGRDGALAEIARWLADDPARQAAGHVAHGPDDSPKSLG
ncbi:hypothetical protein CR162_04230 [Pseudoroseomonas rhizosphaerae]|uniref:Uncharacterized protein n=1 Tax=Teichococcus rhizosphaerae TaxID=1335062 RepID=A0A2C7ADM5_9PROT|nr:hypothetical protein [Pseudoroseomonas rhizosphaerae]PHK96540.1 hypothetical protein CR162_04230 [Pseudoroseomonas rhizosphaerae]